MDFSAILDQILNAMKSDPRVWVPVIIGWGAGLIVVLVLNERGVRRKADRELWVYLANGGAAAAMYYLANFKPTLICFQQALFAGAIALLIPFAWFRFRGMKKSNDNAN